MDTYGYWNSPFTEESITKSSKVFHDIIIDNGNLYWSEMRPDFKGRYVIMREKDMTNITPNDYSVRSRVHEYGGGAFTVNNDHVIFVNFKDQNIYYDNQQLTNNNILRYTCMTNINSYIFAICEEHEEKNDEPKNVQNFIGYVNTKDGETVKIREGCDFYGDLCIYYDEENLDYINLAWIQWDHPNMPWDNTSLYQAKFNFKSNQLEDVTKVCGNNNESIVSPQWSKDGEDLYFITDRTNWWNIYSYNMKSKQIKCVYEMEAEFGRPAWTFGKMSYTILKNNSIFTAYQSFGKFYLGLIEEDGKIQNVELNDGGDVFSNIVSDDNRIVLIRGSVNTPSQLIELEYTLKNEKIIISTQPKILSCAQELNIDKEYISIPKHISFPSNNYQSYAWVYLPKNKDYDNKMNKNNKPPLLVFSHGGPTSQAMPSYNAKIQYWCSRGFVVVDVNYAGSTGYGREYRHLLHNNWGIFDWQDCENVVKMLINDGTCDQNKIAIRGGSAGGFTTLSCLTMSSIFKVGASYYGVSDLSALAKETHKFESRYLDNLIGAAYPSDVYIERSPINHINTFNAPCILFQGDEDQIVPMNQAQMIFKALQEKKLKSELIVYEGEQHGFRKAENIQDSLRRELNFYLEVFSSAEKQ